MVSFNTALLTIASNVSEFQKLQALRTEKQKDIVQLFVIETAQVLASKIVYGISTNEVSTRKLLSWHTVSQVSESQYKHT